MPLDKELKKVLVVGSGPIIIGQAAEFDYAGTQACRSLMEEGIEVVLVNSNPATIMTDTNMADKVYMEPLTPEYIEAIISREKPHGLLPTLGGQVGLNMALELSRRGVLEKYGVRLLGTSLEAIRKAEDREMFRATMQEMGEPIPKSAIVSTVAEAVDFAREAGFPVIVRPAYTLGGTGGGIAADEKQLKGIAAKGLKSSIIGQCLIEESVAGWKEIEFEVMRDSRDTCIAICSMENVDPVGVHTGDSIVVAPAQTLTDREYQMLRGAALKIIRALKIEGGCNVQFAMDTRSFAYRVIEVNPRVSRSSALASKATGYPIAKVAGKIAVGFALDEIRNEVTGKTWASFEPSIDYVVMKVPRWPFDKFTLAQRSIGTQMKATGEVMAVDRTFEGALLKAVRSLEIGRTGLLDPALAAADSRDLLGHLREANDYRLFFLAEALRRGYSLLGISHMTQMDPFFLQKVKNIVDMEKKLEVYRGNLSRVPGTLLRKAKRQGFPDDFIGDLLEVSGEEVRRHRKQLGINPVYKMVDTCGAEFEATTPYFYSTYEEENEALPSGRKKVVVLGSGPIRIGQGVEFDYCSVHSVWALKEEGVEAIIVNNNPETVSTDFDTSDRLYFEPLTAEDVLNILDLEKPEGVIAQFGGQTAINLVEPLAAAGVKIIGTSPADIDRAENRDKFDMLLEELAIPRPAGGSAVSPEQALAIAERVGFPVVVRPSYVLGGWAMEIVYNQGQLEEYVTSAVLVSPRHPVLVDKYLEGRELEVDAVSDGSRVLIPGIMEHVEKAGVHSGDSIAIYPARLEEGVAEKVVDYTTRLARALQVKGIINIQFVYYGGELFILEANPRSSRTVPFMSKVTGIPMVKLATRAALGRSLAEMGWDGGLCREMPFAAVKAPVFSFGKLMELETSLGPEMKSTGEVIGMGKTVPEALHKALVASGCSLRPRGNILATIADRDKEEAYPLLEGFHQLGFSLFATRGTARRLREGGLAVTEVDKIREGTPHIVDIIRQGDMDLVINTLTKGKDPERDGFQIRRAAVEYSIPCLTSLDTARSLLEIWPGLKAGEKEEVTPLQAYLALGNVDFEGKIPQ